MLTYPGYPRKEAINIQTHICVAALWTLSRITRMNRYQNQSGFTGARDSEWQWHQLGHMQICTSSQTDNHARTPPLSFYRSDALPAAQPTLSKH